MRNMDPEQVKRQLEGKKFKNFGIECFKKGKYMEAVRNFNDYLGKYAIFNFHNLTFLYFSELIPQDANIYVYRAMCLLK